MTADELERLGKTLDPCELWDGRLVVREPESVYGSGIGFYLARLVDAHVDERRLGWVFGSSAGFWLRDNPDRVLSPDLAFVSRARVAALPPRGFLRAVPDLVAEIRSPRDSWNYMLQRGGTWIAEGARVVWLVDSDPRRAVTLRPDQPPVEIGPGGVLYGAPVLPDFHVELDVLFARLQ